MPVILAIVIIVIAALVISWLQDRRIRQQTEQRRAHAEALGLQPVEGSPHDLRRKTRQLLLLAQGSNGTFDHVMQGEIEGVSVTLFEYTFFVSVGQRYTRAWKQTVVQLADDDLDLPRFTLIPDNDVALMLANAAGEAVKDWLLGAASARFEDHSTFNEALHLQGPDRAALEAHFDEDLIAFYEANLDLCTEGDDGQLFFYYYDEVLTAEQLDALLKTALEIYQLLKRGMYD